MDLNRSDLFGGIGGEVPNVESLTSESVEGTSLAFQGIDDIHGGDSLPLGVLGVGDGITDDVLKEDLEDTTGLFVDESRDTLDSSTSRQTTDGGLGDALDVITKYLTVTLGASLAESLSSFATSSHCCVDCRSVVTDANTELATNICTRWTHGQLYLLSLPTGQYNGGGDVLTWD